MKTKHTTRTDPYSRGCISDPFFFSFLKLSLIFFHLSLLCYGVFAAGIRRSCGLSLCYCLSVCTLRAIYCTVSPPIFSLKSLSLPLAFPPPSFSLSLLTLSFRPPLIYPVTCALSLSCNSAFRPVIANPLSFKAAFNSATFIPSTSFTVNSPSPPSFSSTSMASTAATSDATAAAAAAVVSPSSSFSCSAGCFSSSCSSSSTALRLGVRFRLEGEAEAGAAAAAVAGRGGEGGGGGGGEGQQPQVAQAPQLE